MKVVYEAHPFAPRSGKIIINTPTLRVERYWEFSDFLGRYFDITFNVDSGNDVSFNISEIKS